MNVYAEHGPEFKVCVNADLEFAILTDLAFGRQVPYVLLRGPVRRWAQWQDGRDRE